MIKFHSRCEWYTFLYCCTNGYAHCHCYSPFLAAAQTVCLLKLYCNDYANSIVDSNKMYNA